MCKTVLLDCREIYVLSFHRRTLQSFLEGLRNGVNKPLVQPPLSECCCPAYSSHRTASLIYSSMHLSLLSLRFYIFQSKWMRQKGGTIPYNQIINTDVKTIWRLTAMELSAIHSLFSPHFSCLMPVAPIAFSFLHKTNKGFGLLL